MRRGKVLEPFLLRPERSFESMPVVHFSTNVSRGCPEGCDKLLGGEDFASGVNHLVQQHGYKIRHIGQETYRGDEGTPFHCTPAVLEK
jgi:hypothetical protein